MTEYVPRLHFNYSFTSANVFTCYDCCDLKDLIKTNLSIGSSLKPSCNKSKKNFKDDVKRRWAPEILLDEPILVKMIP